MYLRSGLNVGSGGITDKEGAWAAFVRETETEVIGNPISPDGPGVRRYNAKRLKPGAIPT